MDPAKMGVTGIALASLSALMAFIWWFSMGYFFLTLYWSYSVSYFMFATLMNAPSIVLAIAGLALYLRKRKAFWKLHFRRRLPLAVVASAMVFLGVFFVSLFLRFNIYASTKHGPPFDRPLGQLALNDSPYYLLFMLWIVFGLLLLADAAFASWGKPRQA